MRIKCYFCQQDLQKEINENCLLDYDDCPSCGHTDQLDSVRTFMDGQGTFLAADLSTKKEKSNICIVPAMGNLKFGRYATLYFNYQITLVLKKNITIIKSGYQYGKEEWITIPGFPINPKNVMEKLKLYLLFS